jgi:hypothetical protein
LTAMCTRMTAMCNGPQSSAVWIATITSAGPD